MFGFGGKKTGKIMLVEDDALLAQVLATALKKENFEVIIVPDGSEALDTVKKTRPSLILLDLILPGMDGFAVLKELKEDSKTSDIPIVIISNLDSVSDIKSTKVLGAEKYFLKADSNLEEIVKFVKSKT
jgi:DNA-binding response OmpR family regulator